MIMPIGMSLDSINNNNNSKLNNLRHSLRQVRTDSDGCISYDDINIHDTQQKILKRIKLIKNHSFSIQKRLKLPIDFTDTDLIGIFDFRLKKLIKLLPKAMDAGFDSFHSLLFELSIFLFIYE